MAIGIFLEITYKIAIQVWSVGCLLEEVTQNPIARTMLVLGSSRREYKKSQMRMIQFDSIFEELKEKTVHVSSRR